MTMARSRLAKVVANMKAMGLKQLVVSDPLSIFYLTGISIDPGQRLFALLVQGNGNAILFNNHLFPLQAREEFEIAYHSDGDDAVGMLADLVEDGPLGIDKTWPARFLLELLAKRPGVKPSVGSAAVDDARMYKDRQEVELMRAASKVNDATMADAIGALAPGVSEKEMMRLVGDFHVKHGADAALPQLVCYGVGSSEPHHEPGASTLQPGDNVILDIFVPVNHYWCDMTRTVFYKTVSSEQEEVYEIVRAANQAGIDAVAPGIPLKAIDAAARRIIEEAGYGQYFTHRLGHGIGLDVHEPPDCSIVSEAVAQPGMCFSIEPGIYLPGKWGVRIEDLVVVTEEGVEVLNSYPKELHVIE